MRVADVMQKSVLLCVSDQSAGEAAQLMAEHKVGCLPVVNAESHPIAMLTDRDLCMAAARSDKRLSELKVSDAMSRGIFTCRPEETLRAAERTMRDWRVRRLPVVDDAGRVIGILTLHDIASAQRNSTLGMARERIYGDVTETLVAVGRRD